MYGTNADDEIIIVQTTLQNFITSYNQKCKDTPCSLEVSFFVKIDFLMLFRLLLYWVLLLQELLHEGKELPNGLHRCGQRYSPQLK